MAMLLVLYKPENILGMTEKSPVNDQQNHP